MTGTGAQRAMQRYFDTLGSEGFVDAVAPGVTWTVTDTGRVISGAHEVKVYIDALHAAMTDTRTQELVLGDAVAFLEGDCSAPSDPGERVAFCVAYDVSDGRVSAMRLYGRLEATIMAEDPTSNA